MNLLDALLVAGAVPAVIGGIRLGFLARASSWLGLAVGFLAAVRLAPAVVEPFADAGAARQLVVAILLLGILGLAGQLLGYLAGARLVVALPPGPARRVDKALGGFAGLAGVVLAAWLLLPVMAGVPEWPARQVAGSGLAELVDTSLPSPPGSLMELAAALAEEEFRPGIGDGELLTDVGEPPNSSPLAGEQLRAAAGSTVRIAGRACGERRFGTGFVIAPGLVITNAHVVAGLQTPELSNVGGEEHRGRIVLFDSAADLAVIAVAGLDAPPLPLGEAGRGDLGVALGHPAGTALVAHPYRVALIARATVEDIYGKEYGTAERAVVVVAAEVGRGDSGGPLISTSGAVVGMSFASSPPGLPPAGWAIDATALEAALARAQLLLRADPAYEADRSDCLTKT
jgi:S1-C subfamily serine protease